MSISARDVRRRARDVRGRSRLAAVAAALLLLGLGAPQALAVFTTPVIVTDGTGTATQTATGLDLANNAYISSVIQEKIRVRIIGPNLNLDAPILANGEGQGDPDFATNSRAVTYMSFSQLDILALEEGREIYLTNNEGGRFQDPVKLTRNRTDDFAPRLVLGPDGNPHLAWTRTVGGENQVRYWNHTMAPDQDVIVAVGEFPALFVDDDDVVHVVYVRGNDIYYVNNQSGAFTSERKVTFTPLEAESSLSIGVDPDRTVLLSYQSKNSLYFATKAAGGAFQSPRLVVKGGVLQPKMRVRRLGQVAIVYAKDGDIYYVTGQSGALNPPERVTETPEVEGSPSLEVDLSNNVHVSFIRDGDVWYTHNAATPDANFAALPTSGEAPLTVKYTDLSSGDVQSWEWDFGDGTTARLQNPSHTYQAPGRYKVSLTVVGPGAVPSVKEVEDFVLVQDPFNTLRIPDQLVFPGQQDVWFPVVGGHKDPIQAFQLMALYDSNVLTLEGYETDFTVIKAMEPEFIVLNDFETYFEFGCIFDIQEPIDKKPLEAGVNQTLLNLVFDVSGGAPQGATTQVTLVNDRQLSRILNIFTVSGQTKIPALAPSTVRILVIEPPFPKFFLRGDANGDGVANIADAIQALNYLFLGGLLTGCQDGADADDNGRVEITDAIGLLNYLFLGGAQPSVPYPMPGLDPSDDALETCVNG